MWLAVYVWNVGSVTNLTRASIPRKFDEEKISVAVGSISWESNSLLEWTKHKFQLRFNETISASYVCEILHKNNLSLKTWKTSHPDKGNRQVLWRIECHQLGLLQFGFLDELAIDNREVFVPRWIQKGFKDFYTGFSVWIFDGAKIHCHPLVALVLSVSRNFSDFLPPYKPFFNPVEIIFGLAKKHIQKKILGALELLVNEEFTEMRNLSCTKNFKSSGYFMSQGVKQLGSKFV